MLALLAVASPARGVELPFRGTLSIEVAALPAVQVAGAGVATLESPPGTAQLTRVALPAGVFAQAGFSVAVSTASAFPIAGLQITAANGPGSFARDGGGALGGVMPIHGVAKVCLFSPCSAAPIANVSIPVGVVGAGGSATGVGPVNVTVVGAPWTTGTAVAGGASQRGSAVGPAGRASTAALPGGRLNLVTPIFISTNIGALASISAFGRVEIGFEQPPPSCEVAVSQASYQNGETLVVTRARFANPRTAATNADLRLELVFPVPGLAVPALDASVTLPAGFETDFGPVDAFSFGPEHPRGRYELRCRVGDPASGEAFASDTASFTLPFSGPAPFCDVEVSQPVYVDGDRFTATRVRFANPQGEVAYLRMRFELGLPDGTVSSVIDSDVALPAGYDQDFGLATAWVVSPAIPRGAYELRCGLSDSYGTPVASDVAAFAVE
jgi:hypothetical protein